MTLKIHFYANRGISNKTKNNKGDKNKMSSLILRITKKSLLFLIALGLLLSTQIFSPIVCASDIPLSHSIASADENKTTVDIPPLYSEDRVLVKLADLPATKSLGLYTVYSKDYVTLNENYYKEQRDNNKAQVKIADSVNNIKSALNLNFDFSKMRMLNPSINTTRGETYCMTKTQNNTFVIELEDISVEEALDELNRNPLIEIAEPDVLYELYSTPNDPYYNIQYALQKINAPQAWNTSTGNSSVVVGIIDSGINGTHPDLVDNLWDNPNPNQNGYVNDIHGYDFVNRTGGTPYDNNGHGTHVAGIIGAKGNNNIGVCGTNWNVSLAWLGVSNGNVYNQNTVSIESVIEALNYCNNHNIRITNNSYGGSSNSTLFKYSIQNYDGLFVVAAGNNGSNNDNFPTYPSNFNCPNIISVSASTSSDERAAFSNFGENSVDVAAPGNEILSTCQGQYSNKSGTSMASPYVAGIAALIQAAHPTYNTRQIRAAICGTVRQTIEDFNIKYNGVVNAAAAIAVNNFTTVTYNLNYGSAATNVDYIVSGDCVEEPMRPERSNYMFTGWYTSATGGNLFNFENTAITSNLTLYAHWVSISSGTYGAEFPDYNFCEQVLNILNNDDNGNRTFTTSISSDDISYMESLTSLTINNKKIRNLSGLEYFSNLTFFNCEGNYISNLPISSLTELEILNCSDCYLTTLNVSNLTNLKTLFCSGNNLSSLILNNLIDLEIIDCSFNNLTSIYVNTLSNLSSINCSYNKLNYLSVSNLNKLTNLNCTSNNLSSLAINGLQNLKYLYCESNRFATLSFNNIPKLESIYCQFNGRLNSLSITNLQGLRDLYCMNNKLKTINLAQTPNLETILCFNNRLSELNLNCCINSLLVVDCSYNRISSLNLNGHNSSLNINCQHNNMINTSKVTGFTGTWNTTNRIFFPQNTWNNPFTDISSISEYYYDVGYVYSNGYMLGTSPTTFSPIGNIDRSSIAILLYRMAGSPSVTGMTNPFSDVPNDNSELNKAIRWAYANGIVGGTTPTTFNPTGYLTRQDLAVVLVRYIDNIANVTLPVKRTYNGVNTFTDHNQIASYALSSVARLYNACIINGDTPNTFNPTGNTKRADVAKIIHSFLLLID